jgi:cytidyltransferase-like protein
MQEKIVLVTGGFDPLHSGHIAYFKAAKKLGNKLVVGVNSDAWLTRKKGRAFMPGPERVNIIQELGIVDHCLCFTDDDDTAIEAIKNVKMMYPDSHVIFANGGDRSAENIPEMVFDDVEFAFGVGGEDKKNSSSWILKNWEKPKTQRLWGNYTILDKQDTWQVKELCFDVNKSLSDQRHFVRSEHWCVVDGLVKMELEYPNGDKLSKTYGPSESIDIPTMTWHKATNIGDVPAKVIEVWMGTTLQEDDIERRT